MSPAILTWLAVATLIHFGLLVLGNQALERLARREVAAGEFVTERRFPNPYLVVSAFAWFAGAASLTLLFLVDWGVDVWVYVVAVTLSVPAGYWMNRRLTSDGQASFVHRVHCDSGLDKKTARAVLRLKYPIFMVP